MTVCSLNRQLRKKLVTLATIMAATKTRTLPPSLFAPDSEEEGSEDSASDVETLDHPLFLPLDDAIKEPPKTLASMLEILLPRISPRPDLKSVSVDDQQSLVNILIGELASQFPLLKHQINDPFLTNVQNFDLQRKMVIQICLLLEKLYTQYVAKAATFSKSDLFSVPSNMSRLKAELMLKVNKSLNISTIRRSVIAQLRGLHPTHPVTSHPITSQLPPLSKPKREKFNLRPGTDYQGLRDSLSKKLTKLGVNPLSVTRDTDHSVVTMDTKPGATDKTYLAGPSEREGKLETAGDGVQSCAEPLRVQVHKATSMPNLKENFMLMDQGVPLGGSHTTARQQAWGTRRTHSVESILDLKMDTFEHAPEIRLWAYEHTLLGRFTSAEVGIDLKKLCNEWTTSSNPEDLDPLLQAQVHALSKKQASRLSWYEAQKRNEGITKEVQQTLQSPGNTAKVSQDQRHRSGDYSTNLEATEVLNSSHQATSPVLRCAGMEGGGATMDRTAQTQPSVITSMGGDGETLARTADIRVSERGPLTTLRLLPHPPVYNELTGELDPSTIVELDQNLCEGRDLTVLYDEVLRALPKTHLDFMRESQSEPTITHMVNLSKVVASETLHHRKSRRVMNSQLHQTLHPPWEATHTTRKVWEGGQPYQRPQDEKGDRTCSSQMRSRDSSHTLGYPHGRTTTIDSQDYFKFVSRQPTDYLCLIHHLYDSDGTDSETEEEEKARRQQLAEMHHRLKAREAKRKQKYKLKSNYEAGQWNVNAVTMGGLGGDPDLSSSDEGSNAETSVQEKLGIIWNRLHFLPAQQVDMAIKYSSADFSSHLNAALDAWECACVAIEKREQVLTELQSFEKMASDPARFFTRGHLGSSVARLEEAKHRDRLHQELDQRDKEVSQIICKIFCEYGDRVSYNGRLYQEKMACDRTEMLYWLQQERRKEILRPAVRTLHNEVPLL